MTIDFDPAKWVYVRLVSWSDPDGQSQSKLSHLEKFISHDMYHTEAWAQTPTAHPALPPSLPLCMGGKGVSAFFDVQHV